MHSLLIQWWPIEMRWQWHTVTNFYRWQTHLYSWHKFIFDMHFLFIVEFLTSDLPSFDTIYLKILSWLHNFNHFAEKKNRKLSSGETLSMSACPLYPMKSRVIDRPTKIHYFFDMDVLTSTFWLLKVKMTLNFHHRIL